MSDDRTIVFSYTRAQALEDGVLVDVSKLASEAGFKYPVALTCTVYEKYVKVPHGVECQDETGRLWDILNLCRFAAAKSSGESEILFKVYVRNDNRRATLVTLKSVCGPNDDGSPCVTIMLPEED